jgi:hypothetical protein
MKTANLALAFGITGFLAAAVIVVTCQRNDGALPAGFVIIPQSTWDSIQRIAALPPDTVEVIDSFIANPEIIYVDRPVPIPTPITPEINSYADSVKASEVNIWWEARTVGVLDDFNIQYQLKQPVQTITIEKPVPYPVEVRVSVPDNGLYLSGGMGGGFHTGKFVMGMGLDYVTKKNWMVGLQYQRYGTENIVAIRGGLRISPRHK